MTNILQQEIKKAFSKHLFLSSHTGAGFYDFEDVLTTAQKHPELIDSQDENGNTLLHHFMNKYHTICNISPQDLVQLNANPFQKNKQGLTPRMLLDTMKHPQVNNFFQAYESSYQASCLANAIEAQAAIIKNQVMEHQTYQPKTAKGVLLAERTTHSPYYRQPQEVLKARSTLEQVVQKLRGNSNQNG